MKKEKRAQKAWTTLEERYLKQNAGFLCISEIALRLDRSEASVKSKASRLRKQNGCLSLRHFKSKLVWCPRCATLRTKLFSKTGHCMVCRLRDRHSRIVDDCETALLSLGEEHRFYYEVYEGYRQSSLPKRPVSTSIKGLDTYAPASCLLCRT